MDSKPPEKYAFIIRCVAPYSLEITRSTARVESPHETLAASVGDAADEGDPI
jgi:hypothetical protein